MEILGEILFELFGQLFLELIVQFLVFMFSPIFNIYEKNKVVTKKVKMITVYIFFSLVLCLLIFSMFTKKGLYIKIILVYLILMLFVYFFKYINRNLFKNRFKHIIRVLTSILHYVLSISIIIATNKNEITKSGTIIIILSSISIIIFLILDIFRIIKATRKRSKKEK